MKLRSDTERLAFAEQCFTNAREGAVHFYTERIAVPDADRIHAGLSLLCRFAGTVQSLEQLVHVGAGFRESRLFLLPELACAGRVARGQLEHAQMRPETGNCCISM